MKSRSSEIDKSYEITADRWVLNMARKTNGTHQEHTFLIVEGIEDGRAVVWFMDLVGTPLLPNIKNAHIRIENFSADSELELETHPLLYRCKRKMMDLQPDDTMGYLNWPIEKEDANTLINRIKQDKNNPPVFNIFGKHSKLTGSSAKSSSKERGHNCFTYAKERINDLDLPHVKIKSNDSDYYMEQIACISSLTLKAPRKQVAYCPYFNKKVAVIGFGLAISAAAVVIEATRRYSYSP